MLQKWARTIRLTDERLLWKCCTKTEFFVCASVRQGCRGYENSHV